MTAPECVDGSRVKVEHGEEDDALRRVDQVEEETVAIWFIDMYIICYSSLNIKSCLLWKIVIAVSPHYTLHKGELAFGLSCNLAWL